MPICRTETEDEWFDFQFSIIKEIFDKANLEGDANILLAGDIFDRSIPSIKIINRLLMLYKKHSYLNIFGIAGNHDLKYHNFSLINESGYDTLTQGEFFNHDPNISEHHFNTEYTPEWLENEITLCHHLCFPDKKSIPPNVNAYTPDDIFKMYPDSKYIICGDYHQGHVTEKDGRFVIVPGCTTVQASDLVDYKPRVYVLDTDEGTVEPIYLYNPTQNIDISHIEEKHDRDDRINEFIDKLKRDNKLSLSFTDNLKNILHTKIDKDVKEIIIQLMEEVDDN
ncbi:MAG: hypothetical protein OMM_05419 [Candidatus Magnetoglobus multicellularis str. Araruama]|uniref:Calcineurin-like phosphoesterase domain-containing protein n=1 Tax=Candidatus Magnetoglobus multicellularis str. Araruama TaxID=890399 RepID=A0A1V1NWJ4_9BACT|nr:MAG: hypothetical protein OMM_05419 [Candidatus Magnetoglobus multicellularis str. Araruama]